MATSNQPINSKLFIQVEENFQGEVPNFEVQGLDLAGSQVYESFLTFLDSEDFIHAAVNNGRVKVIVCTETIASEVKASTEKIVIAVPDPRWTYFSMQNLIASRRHYSENNISSLATIHPSAVIAEHDVSIGDEVIIEAGVIVNSFVSIGNKSIIRANAVLGSPGFEHKRTSKGILSVKHDGELIIGTNTEIGSSCVIAEGYARRNTIIGDDCRLDGLVYIAHGVHVGDRVFFAANSVVAGMCTIENDVWIGPKVAVRDQIRIGRNSRVAIGSTVMKNVAADSTVFGTPARKISP